MHLDVIVVNTGENVSLRERLDLTIVSVMEVVQSFSKHVKVLGKFYKVFAWRFIMRIGLSELLFIVLLFVVLFRTNELPKYVKIIRDICSNARETVSIFKDAIEPIHDVVESFNEEDKEEQK